MTLSEIKAKYLRLRREIEVLEGSPECSRVWLERLISELDTVESEYSAQRRRAEVVPTLSDVIALEEPMPRRSRPAVHLASVS